MNVKEFAEKYFKAEDEAWYKGNFTLLDELEDPNIVIHMPPPLPDLIGHEAHKQDIIRSRQHIIDNKLEWKFLDGEKNVYAVSLKQSFQVKNEPGTNLPAGKKVSSTRICFGRLKKGKLLEGWVDGSSKITD
jgi:hypothetical protein